MNIEFYFDFISPFSYLAAVRLPLLQRATGSNIEWIPVNLPRLMKLSGNTPPGLIPNKARYLLLDLKRQAKRLQVPLKIILPGTFDSRHALGLACVLPDAQRICFSIALFSQLWSGKMDVKQDGWLEKYLEQYGSHPEWQSVSNEAMTEVLQANTMRAFVAGAFGAPTFVLHYKKRRELYFGLDHMTDLQDRCIELCEEG
ncbi:MAG: DsbA family protein [Mariprofundaceae bacterium]|nr:DsbA family protein [Mariprofundaceae bacterium]